VDSGNFRFFLSRGKFSRSTKEDAMGQIHKRFTDEQIRMLFRKYSQGQLSQGNMQELLGIGRSRFFELLQVVEHGAGNKAEKVIAIGGAVRNKFWMQNKADVCGRVIEAPKIEEATALGAAMLAGTGAGLYNDLDEAVSRVQKPGEIFEPDLKLTSEYKEYFEIYKEIYPALKPVNKRIYDRFRVE